MWMVVVGLLGCFLKDDGVETCALACDTLYQEGECDISRPGRTAAELLDYCNLACVEAWAIDCEEEDCLGDFDPYDNLTSGSTVALTNREQAELWTDCIQDMTCDEIRDGYCAPVW